MGIHILAPDVAAKIAAGEVVERPANVAKELIENSLDAGATEVKVELREGGQRLLRISDNGHGMPAEDVPLAFLRHATSKLSTVDELSHLATFGFRGEALYSIAAVSQVTVTTRHRSEPFGTQIHVAGSEVGQPQRAGSPIGTIVTVEHLFYNIPARQKFLRRASTETGKIADLVQRFALTQPQCVSDFMLCHPTQIFRLIWRTILTRWQIGTHHDVRAAMITANGISAKDNAPSPRHIMDNNIGRLLRIVSAAAHIGQGDQPIEAIIQNISPGSNGIIDGFKLCWKGVGMSLHCNRNIGVIPPITRIIVTKDFQSISI
jgi:DNA mismatch repair protein MutL